MRDVRYLIYRCYVCGRLLTKLELEATWRRLEENLPPEGEPAASALCPCGSNKVTPGNALWWEEFLPRVLKLWWVEIAWPWVKGKFRG